MKQMKVIFKKYLQERVRVQRAAEAMVVTQQLILAEEDRQALRYALHAQRLEEAHALVVSLGPASPTNSDDYGPIAGENYEDDEQYRDYHSIGV